MSMAMTKQILNFPPMNLILEIWREAAKSGDFNRGLRRFILEVPKWLERIRSGHLESVTEKDRDSLTMEELHALLLSFAEARIMEFRMRPEVFQQVLTIAKKRGIAIEDVVVLPSDPKDTDEVTQQLQEQLPHLKVEKVDDVLAEDLPDGLSAESWEK